MYRVVANPETFDKKRVAVSGFPVAEGDQFVLYVNRESRRQGIAIESLLVDIAREEVPKELVAGISSGVSGVHVLGTLDMRSTGAQPERLGVIGSIRRAFVLPAPEGFPGIM